MMHLKALFHHYVNANLLYHTLSLMPNTMQLIPNAIPVARPQVIVVSE